MGLAPAAELNGYPGPSHLLELADQLHLSDAQRSGARGMFEAMKAETVPIGERLIAQEAELDKLFADHAITPSTAGSAIFASATPATQRVIPGQPAKRRAPEPIQL
jgi:hypothetical protein